MSEKKMFGGIAWLLNGNMTVGVTKDALTVRFDKERHEEILKRKYAEPMDFTGKPLRGFVFVAEKNVKTAAALRKWIDLSVEYAKTLPKK